MMVLYEISQSHRDGQQIWGVRATKPVKWLTWTIGIFVWEMISLTNNLLGTYRRIGEIKQQKYESLNYVLSSTFKYSDWLKSVLPWLKYSIVSRWHLNMSDFVCEYSHNISCKFYLNNWYSSPDTAVSTLKFTFLSKHAVAHWILTNKKLIFSQLFINSSYVSITTL